MGIVLTNFVDDMAKFITKHAVVYNRRLLRGGDIANIAQTRMTSKGVYQASQAELGPVLQGFHKNFQPKGDAEFKPIEIPIRRCKVDMSFYPDDLEDQWLGFLVDESLSKADMPFVRWVMEQKIMPRLDSDLEQASYRGVYVANPGTGVGHAYNSFDGLETTVNKLYATGRTQLIASGAITPSNVFERLEQFIDGLNEEYDNANMQLLTSNRQLRNYFRDRRNTHGQDVNYNPNTQNTTVDFTDVNLNGVTGMKGKQRIIATPSDNVIRLIDKVEPREAVNWDIQTHNREVKVLGDFHYAVGLLIPEAVAHTDAEM